MLGVKGMESSNWHLQGVHASKASSEKRKTDIDPLDQMALLAKITKIMATDPTNPLKPQEMQQSFNSAIAALNSAKQIDISEKLLESHQLSHLLQAGYLVGQKVETKGSQFSVEGACLKYKILEKALGTHIEIMDENGDIVRSIKADGPPGDNVLSLFMKAEGGEMLAGNNHTYRTRTFMPSVTPGDFPSEILSEERPLSIKKSLPELSYIIPKGASKTDIYVVHEKTGRIVQKIPGQIAEGRHYFEIQDVESLPPDSYKFDVKAFDQHDVPLEVETRVSGIVDGVEAKNGQNFLRRGSIYEPLERLTGVLKTNYQGG